LQMTQHADNIWNEGKFLLLSTGHKRCWTRYPSTRKYLSQLIILKKKNTRTITHYVLTAHQAPTSTGWLQQLCCRSCTRLLTLQSLELDVSVIF
jgi:hypothetical protein